MYLSSNLSYLRKRDRLSQAEIAERFNLGSNTIGSYERGDREPTLDCLLKLSQFFNVTVDDLLTKDLRPQGSLLSNNLKFLQKTAGYTQTDMARLLGYKGKSSLSLIESGSTELSVDNLLNISEFFGVTVDDLLKKDLSKGGIEGANAGEEDCG